MAMARVNRPSVMVYGGTIRAGCRPEHDDDKLDIISAFEAYGKFTTGKIGDKVRARARLRVGVGVRVRVGLRLRVRVRARLSLSLSPTLTRSG